jgi:hypothetical protein
MLAADKEATEPRVPSDEDEVTASSCFSIATMSWLTVTEYL